MQERNLLLTIRFDGSCFAGWIVQKNAVAVMPVLQNAMQKVFSERPDVKGCSRTDSGVHALNFRVSFKTTNAIPVERVIIALNCHLPNSIAVVDCEEVPLDFHARYSATAKLYCYKVLNTPIRDPFFDKRMLYIGDVIDESVLDEQAKQFIGKHDFKAFSNKGNDLANTTRTIYSFDVKREGDTINFFVCGDGFLYNMVRIMVGTLLNIESGLREKDCIPLIIASKNRVKAGVTVPPYGLYLDQVFYTEDF